MAAAAVAAAVVQASTEQPRTAAAAATTATARPSAAPAATLASASADTSVPDAALADTYVAVTAAASLLGRRMASAGAVLAAAAALVGHAVSLDDLRRIAAVVPNQFHLQPRCPVAADLPWCAAPAPGAATELICSPTVLRRLSPDSMARRRAAFLCALAAHRCRADDRPAATAPPPRPQPPIGPSVPCTLSSEPASPERRLCGTVGPIAPDRLVEHLQCAVCDGGGELVHVEQLAPRAACYGPPVDALRARVHPTVVAALRAVGIDRLYTHQCEAIDACMADGQDVLVCTATSSGKSLCYTVPVLSAIARAAEAPRPGAAAAPIALLLFPTKALARDQLRALSAITRGTLLESYVHGYVYDGDTPPADRVRVRAEANVILTNPDTLHAAVLPNHRSWPALLERLQFVVVDEAHVYRGTFGSHVACVLRRLIRLCYIHAGRRPRFILCSATIANPGEHAMRLVAAERAQLRVVSVDGSPQGPRTIAIWSAASPCSRQWQPSMRTDAVRPNAPEYLAHSRGGPNIEAGWIAGELAHHGLRAIVFCRYRKVTEIVLRHARRILDAAGQSAAGDRTRTYRAGHTPSERRRVECDLLCGRVAVVMATNALELGVDIGTLDATVHVGFPGTIASLWQQIGRAGRTGRASVAVYVARDDYLDRYFCADPQRLLRAAHEAACIDPYNHYILHEHLVCAAGEWPVTLAADAALFGPDLALLLGQLCAGRAPDGSARVDGPRLRADSAGRYFPVGAGAPDARQVHLRGVDAEPIEVRHRGTGALLGTVDLAHAYFEVHTGAVYWHQGDAYLVERLDLDERVAYVQPCTSRPAYHTIVQDHTMIVTQQILRSCSAVGRGDADGPAPAAAVCAHCAAAEVRVHVFGYHKIHTRTRACLETVPLAMPPLVLRTRAMYFEVPRDMRDACRAAECDFKGGLHGASHAIASALAVLLMSDAGDIGTECPCALERADLRPHRIVIFDRRAGGVGLAERSLDAVGPAIAMAAALVRACPCLHGCPLCVYDWRCKEHNLLVDKRAARLLLLRLLGGVSAA